MREIPISYRDEDDKLQVQRYVRLVHAFRSNPDIQLPVRRAEVLPFLQATMTIGRLATVLRTPPGRSLREAATLLGWTSVQPLLKAIENLELRPEDFRRENACIAELLIQSAKTRDMALAVMSLEPSHTFAHVRVHPVDQPA